MKTKNHFINDLLDPIWGIVSIILLIVDITAFLVMIIVILFYASWISNVICVNSEKISVSYPNWKFWKRSNEFKFDEVHYIKFHHYSSGAYDNIPYFDVYPKDGKRNRVYYTPSITKEEYKNLIDMLRLHLGERLLAKDPFPI